MAESAGVANAMVLHLVAKLLVSIAEERRVAVRKYANVGAEVREDMSSLHFLILKLIYPKAE